MMKGKRRLLGVAGVLALLALAGGVAQWQAMVPRTPRARILAMAAALGPCMRAVARTEALLHGGAGRGATLARAAEEQDRACRLAGLWLNLTPGLNTNVTGNFALGATKYARWLAGYYSTDLPGTGSEDDELRYNEDIWFFMSYVVDVLGSPAAAARSIGVTCWTQGTYPEWSMDCRAPSTTGG
jgi:hypothetical protein